MTLAAIVVIFASVLTTAVLAADRDPESSAAAMMTPAAEKSIERGLKWLAAVQHDDGGFGSGMMRGNTAVTALAGMAFMSGGSTPGRGPYGKHVARAVDYLLASAQPSGFIAGPDASRGPMYGHGFATMFLAECYGMAPQAELRQKLSKAVDLIVHSQNKEGGWRYDPIPPDEADISVTVCQVMALRAGRNAAIAVPSETVDRAVAYIKRSQNPDGGFAYQLRLPRESLFPRSAAAVTALYSAGVYKGPELTKGLDYLMDFVPSAAEKHETYYYYGQYYAVQAMWQAGGERWRRWYPAGRDQLIKRQRDDGSWTDAASGNECATAMSCIVLQIPNNYLPIFQR